MGIETFRHGEAPIHAHFTERRRKLPTGLFDLDSWIDDAGAGL
jgi:hypothetical protein